MPVKTPRPSMDIGRITRQYPVETRVESYAQTDLHETDEDISTAQLDHSLWSDSHLDTGIRLVLISIENLGTCNFITLIILVLFYLTTFVFSILQECKLTMNITMKYHAVYCCSTEVVPNMILHLCPQ